MGAKNISTDTEDCALWDADLSSAQPLRQEKVAASAFEFFSDLELDKPTKSTC